MIALVFVHTKLVWFYGLRCKVRNDDGYMANGANHGIFLICAALDRLARVGMNIGHYVQPGLATDFPKIPKVGAIEDNNARVQAVRVKIIVINNLSNPAYVALAVTEQEGAAFATPHATPL